jgi:hypothetical protein
LSAWTSELIGYGRNDGGVAVSGRQEGADPMTTDAGLPSVRESLQPALLAEPEGSSLVDELAEAAADHYHLNYSKHPVPVLFREVRAARTLDAACIVRYRNVQFINFSGGVMQVAAVENHSVRCSGGAMRSSTSDAAWPQAFSVLVRILS